MLLALALAGCVWISDADHERRLEDQIPTPAPTPVATPAIGLTGVTIDGEFDPCGPGSIDIEAVVDPSFEGELATFTLFIGEISALSRSVPVEVGGVLLVEDEPATAAFSGAPSPSLARLEVSIGDQTEIFQQSVDVLQERFSDGDGDGFAGTPSSDCEAAEASTDCDDSDSDVNPGALEIVGGPDEDCDGTVSCGLGDSDGDGQASEGSLEFDVADAPASCDVEGTDCDDSDILVYSGAPEACDGVDTDCDGLDDAADPDAPQVLSDGDGDGYGELVDCIPGTAVPMHPQVDCDDMDATISPGSVEAFGNAVDENCDGVYGCFDDSDGDGFGSDTTIEVADPNECRGGGDCDDNDSDTNPVAIEVAGNSVDENCDGLFGCYMDADGDTVGAETLQEISPFPGADCKATGEDCDDSNSTILPGVDETCDDIDRNCDGIPSDVVGFTRSDMPVALYVLPDDLASFQDGTDGVTVTLCGVNTLPEQGAQISEDFILLGIEDARLEGRLVVLEASTAVTVSDIEWGPRLSAQPAADGGLLEIRDGSVLLLDVVMSGGVASARGGAVHVENGSLEVRATMVQGSVAQRGGAISLAPDTVFSCDNSTFFDNTATVHGGSLVATGAEIILDNCSFAGSASSGSSFYLAPDPGSLSGEVSVFGEPDANAGALYIEEDWEVLLTDTEFPESPGFAFCTAEACTQANASETGLSCGVNQTWGCALD